jgi:hypothetical protein
VLSFEDELRALLNTHSMETDSGTADSILARYMMACLYAFNEAVRARERAYGRVYYLAESVLPPREPTGGEEGR